MNVMCVCSHFKISHDYHVTVGDVRNVEHLWVEWSTYVTKRACVIPGMYQNAAGVSCLVGYAGTGSKKNNLWELLYCVCLSLYKLLFQSSKGFWKPVHTLCLFNKQLCVQFQFSFSAKEYQHYDTTQKSEVMKHSSVSMLSYAQGLMNQQFKLIRITHIESLL